MDAPEISVIVPVYNVEKYLERCVDSLLVQTFRDLEILLVDDGSTDSSGLICDSYAQKDSRIRVIHKENGGLSDARNAGLEIASCELVAFVDSDDYIAPDMYEVLYRNLLRENADIATCGVYNCFPNKTVTDADTTSLYVVDSHDAVRRALESWTMPLYAWNKLYKKRLFCQIRFPVGKIYEDAFVMIRLLDLAEKVVISMEPKYYYVRREGSISTGSYRPSVFDMIEAHTQNQEFVLMKYPDLIQQAEFRCLWANFVVLDKMLLAESGVDEQKKNEIIRLLRANLSVIVKCPWFSKARKISALLLCVHEKLYKVCAAMAAKCLM